MTFVPLDLTQTLRIRRLYSLHYFRYATGFVFPGERHNFWEMVYIDRGEADIGAGKRRVRLTQGQVIFHKPNEFHSIWASYADAPNIMVVSFAAHSPSMRSFCDFSCTLDMPARRILRSILQEAHACFGPVLDGADRLIPLDTSPIGCQQLIGNYLEMLLISLLRGQITGLPAESPSPVTHENTPVALIDTLSQYMRAHVADNLSFSDILLASGVGRTTLKETFRRYAHAGVMAYYQRIRLEEARRLLSSGHMNITQTAEALGYPSIHAFSRQFTHVLGITPGAYMKSVRP